MNKPRNYIEELKSEKAKKLAEDLSRTLDLSFNELRTALLMVSEGLHFECSSKEIFDAINAILKNRKE